MAKSAVEKLRTPQQARIVRPLPPRVAHWGPPGSSMVISTPAEVDALVNRIPKGKLATLATLRQSLATQHDATIACPVTTGIFMGIVARAAEEREMMGAKRVAPWWRVLTSDGQLNPRMPGGLAEHRRRLEAEGFTIVKAGRSGLLVEGFEQRLARL